MENELNESVQVKAYRNAYETANKKPLVITISGDTFFVEGLPYKISRMTWMTENLNSRILRTTREEKILKEACYSCEYGLCPDGNGGFVPCTICGREK